MDNQNVSLEVAPKQVDKEIVWLANKVRVIGEYLVASEPGELTGPEHCDYWNIGERLYRVELELQELVE